MIQPPAQKIPNKQATFSGLDKITGRIIAFDVAINETVQFGALQVTPRVCYTRPPTEAANTDAFLEVDEITLQGEIKRLFTGWMFAASPGLHAIEHPIYDIWLADCKGPQAPTVAEVTPEPARPDAAEAAAAPEAGRAADLRAAADRAAAASAARATAAATAARAAAAATAAAASGGALAGRSGTRPARTRYENRKSSSFRFASVTLCGVATYSCLAPHCASISAVFFVDVAINGSWMRIVDPDGLERLPQRVPHRTFQFLRIDQAELASLQKLEVGIGCAGISIISSAGTGPMDLDIAAERRRHWNPLATNGTVALSVMTVSLSNVLLRLR